MGSLVRIPVEIGQQSYLSKLPYTRQHPDKVQRLGTWWRLAFFWLEWGFTRIGDAITATLGWEREACKKYPWNSYLQIINFTTLPCSIHSFYFCLFSFSLSFCLWTFQFFQFEMIRHAAFSYQPTYLGRSTIFNVNCCSKKIGFVSKLCLDKRAAIAQRLHLRLPSCGPGFESHSPHLPFL